MKKPPVKPWYTSKILIFNILMAALASLEASAGFIQPYVRGDIYGWGLTVLTVGNAMLRVFSSQALSLKKDDQP